ncbi:hypothetical protein MHUMG1_07621 [Metarhizium humberi]|uniref:Uncharacterized protein n=1 Tax=Metarhizium humberi TaxID=2596975 RepID=A0A9P8M755_9HYPO|nr:hypothetical protein MHUMG1_07621 [Metarhizium humberi]
MTLLVQTLHLTEFTGAAACLVLAVILVIFKGFNRKPPSLRPEKDEAGKAADQNNFKSRDFKMPTPPPYPEWSIESTKPLPYRALRYGPKYNVTMGLRTIPPIEWVELNCQFPKYHADKAARLLKRGEKCAKTHPDTFPAAVELL